VVRCMNAQDVAKKKLLSQHIVRGQIPLSNDESGWILLGHRLAESLSVSLGSAVELMAPEGIPTAFGPMPKAQHFRVVGLFDCGMHEYDSTFAVISLADGLTFFDLARPSVYEVVLQDSDVPVARALTVLRSIPRVHCHDWRESNSHFFQAIQVQRHVMFVILTLIILVAAFNIVCCLMMLVKDKTREIAILRTLGATQRSILRLFVLAGLWIGGAGTLTGGAVGLAIAYYVDPIRRFLEKMAGANLFQSEFYFLSALPFRIVPSEVVGVIVLALLCSVVAAFYPAWRASRLPPVKGLRYD
jgi:lipoprotein-releasing system permease protein